MPCARNCSCSERAGGLAVQAVRQVHLAAELLGEQMRHRVVLDLVGGVRERAAGLVDDDQALVLPQDGHGLVRDRRLLRARVADEHQLAVRHALRGLGLLAAQEHAPFPMISCTRAREYLWRRAARKASRRMPACSF
jgi:hypothetical protein